MSNYDVSIGILSSKVAELENFQEMILKKHPDLSNEFKEYKEEKRKMQREECCNFCENFLKVCFVLLACYIFYEIAINK